MRNSSPALYVYKLASLSIRTVPILFELEARTCLILGGQCFFATFLLAAMGEVALS